MTNKERMIEYLKAKKEDFEPKSYTDNDLESAIVDLIDSVVDIYKMLSEQERNEN